MPFAEIIPGIHVRTGRPSRSTATATPTRTPWESDWTASYNLPDPTGRIVRGTSRYFDDYGAAHDALMQIQPGDRGGYTLREPFYCGKLWRIDRRDPPTA